MPSYDFRNKETGEIEEHTFKISEYDKFIEDHPELERVILSAPVFNKSSHGFGSVSDIAAKKDKGWKEVLQKIANQNPVSQVGDDFRSKGIKEAKTTEIINKHVKIQEKQRAERAAKVK